MSSTSKICDDGQCPAMAQATVAQIAGPMHSLDFCGHHLHKYADALDAQGFRVTIPKRVEYAADFFKNAVPA